jgi:sugar lactone lactonase YvrE
VKLALWGFGFLSAVAGILLAAQPAKGVEKPALEAVAEFGGRQVTGVAVSPKGRVFVNFPFWADNHTLSVAEVMKDGSLKPFPDDAWNRRDGSPHSRWVCVQSVYCDDLGYLWVLDPASPKMAGVVKGGAKLVKCDLATNKVVETILFDETIAPEHSYLNDVRVDTRTGHAYITESGLGALIVVDLHNGTPRRLLADDPSTKAEPGVTLKMDGIDLIDPKTGKTPQIHCDGVALDRDHGNLYFHSLTGHKLHRLKLRDLRDSQITDAELSRKVETFENTPAADGMLAGPGAEIYITDLEHNSVVRWNAITGEMEKVVEDGRLDWPDSMAGGPDGELYVTASQINRTPRFNQGQDKTIKPFQLFRVRPKAPELSISPPNL